MSTNAPHDPDPSDAAREDARLQDLLDGRLDDDAADALRARIEAEPALHEAWDELRGIQALVRGYGPEGADLDLPDDFLARVKTQIGAVGLPASGAGVVAGGVVAPDADFAGDADGPGAQPRRRPGRMLRVLTVAYAAAALLVVGFTVRYVLTDPPPPAGPVRTAQEDFDREAPSEIAEADGLALRLDEARDAKTAAAGAVAREKLRAQGFGQELDKNTEKRKSTEKRDGGTNDLDKPGDADEPAGAIEDFGMRSAKTRTGAPEPAVGGGTIAGRYGAPGGAVHPGARPLPGAQPRDRRGGAREPLETAEAAREEKLARLLADGDGPVYVLEVDDASQARAAVAALLSNRMLASLADDLPRDGNPAAGKPKSTDPKPDDSPSPVRRRGAPDAPAAAEGADEEKEAAPRGRLYRVDAAQAGRLLLALRAQTPTEASAGATSAGEAGPAKSEGAAEADSKDAGDGSTGLRLALLDVVTPELDEVALARLDRRALRGVWGGETLARLVKKSGPAEPQAARPSPTPASPIPTTPAPPTSPRAPAPSKPAGAARAADDEAEPAQAPAPKPKRVRILVLERK